jgi:hypothetical protein
MISKGATIEGRGSNVCPGGNSRNRSTIKIAQSLPSKTSIQAASRRLIRLNEEVLPTASPLDIIVGSIRGG